MPRYQEIQTEWGREGTEAPPRAELASQTPRSTHLYFIPLKRNFLENAHMFDKFIPVGLLQSTRPRNALPGCAEQTSIRSAVGEARLIPGVSAPPLLPSRRGLEELLLPWIQERGILSRQNVITQIGTQPGHCEENYSSLPAKCQGRANDLQSAPPLKWGTGFGQDEQAALP